MWVGPVHLCSEKDIFTKSRRWTYLFYFLFSFSQMSVEMIIATTTEQFTFIQKLLSQRTLQLYIRINPPNVTFTHGLKCNSSFNNAHSQYYSLEYYSMNSRRILVTFHSICKLNTTFQNVCAKRQTSNQHNVVWQPGVSLVSVLALKSFKMYANLVCKVSIQY